MRIFRFMSRKEFYKLIKGEKLINKTKHEGHTNSVGFCFMEGEPEECYEFLSGVVSDEVCVVFETTEKLKQTYGIYADPYGSFFSTITRDEYCIKEYNKGTFKIIKMAIPSFWDSSWKWYKNIKTFCDKLEEIEKKEKEYKKIERIKDKAKQEVDNQNGKKIIELLQDYYKIKEMILKKDEEEYYFKPIAITNVEIEGEMSYTKLSRKQLKFEIIVDL